MVDAYLGQPNYTNAMVSGLSTRLAYMNRKKGGGSLRGGGGGSDRIARDGSTDYNAGYRNQMAAGRAQDAAVNQLTANTEKTKADTAQTEATTEQTKAATEQVGKVKPPTDLEKADLKTKELGLTKGKLAIAAKFIPMADRKTWDSLQNWMGENGIYIPGLATSEDVLKMNDVELAQHKSLVAESLKDPDVKLLESARKAEKDANDLRMKEEAAAAKEAAAAAKIEADQKAKATRVYTDILKQYNGDEELMPPEVLQTYRAAKAVVEGQLAGTTPVSAPTIPPDMMAAFKAKYPNKTDAEILAAYARLTGTK